MQYYRCLCGLSEFWGSGMFPPPCSGCVVCNTTLSGSPTGHETPKPHEWVRESVETDEGEVPGLSYCRFCYGKKRDLTGPGLGLDFGNVLKAKGEYKSIEGAEEGVKELKKLFKNRIWVISKVDDKAGEDKVINFLDDNWHGYRHTIRGKYFTRRREEKAPIAERLGVTHFIDDRTEVLSYMKSVQHRIALNPTDEQLENFPPQDIIVVKNWAEAVEYVKGTFPLKT